MKKLFAAAALATSVLSASNFAEAGRPSKTDRALVKLAIDAGAQGSAHRVQLNDGQVNVTALVQSGPPSTTGTPTARRVVANIVANRVNVITPY